MENPVYENQTEVKQNRKNSEAFLKADAVSTNSGQNQKFSCAPEMQTNYATLDCCLRYFNMYVLNNTSSITVPVLSHRLSDFWTDYEMTRLGTLTPSRNTMIKEVMIASALLIKHRIGTSQSKLCP